MYSLYYPYATPVPYIDSLSKPYTSTYATYTPTYHIYIVIFLMFTFTFTWYLSVSLSVVSVTISYMHPAIHLSPTQYSRGGECTDLRRSRATMSNRVGKSWDTSSTVNRIFNDFSAPHYCCLQDIYLIKFYDIHLFLLLRYINKIFTCNNLYVACTFT